MPLLPRRPATGSRLILAGLGLALGLVAACESEPRRSPVLARELDKICHAVELSGAAGLEDANRMAMVAMWLDQNIKSDEGLAFLRTFAKLGNDKDARRQMIVEAARTNGIADCPLIEFWR